MPARRRKNRALLWLPLTLLVFWAIAIGWLLTGPEQVEIWLQNRVLMALREHYHGDVRLQNLRVTLTPIFQVTADNFVLPNRNRADLPPLITVRHLTVQTPLFELLRTPVHLSWMKLDGLKIQVIPNRDHAVNTVVNPRYHTHLANFVIDKVEADETELDILRKDPGKQPLEWEIRKLRLSSAGIGQPMRFQANLTNPTPPGVIETTGHFGPWNFDQPSATAVDGHYSFQHADLSVFTGISGILSSTGDYMGTLHNIVIDGATEIPDFQLDNGGQAVHLTTRFHATVDGTNGNTYLQPVNAHFLNSNITVTRGEIAGSPGQKGKSIVLDIDTHDARVQDFLLLASKAERAVLTGQLKLQAQLTLPPGNDRVLQRILLNGRFNVPDANFNNDLVRKVITEMSRLGQGKPTDTSIEDVLAELEGDFRLEKSDMHFSKLQLLVPGAATQLKGSYGLHSHELNFVGDVQFDATVSQMIKGGGRWMVLLDPIFMRHGAGMYLPVSISGTREHPQIKLKWKKIFKG